MSNFNTYDKIRYGTDAERLADTTYVNTPTAKWFVYETDTLYVSDGTTWHEVS